MGIIRLAVHHSIDKKNRSCCPRIQYRSRCLLFSSSHLVKHTTPNIPTALKSCSKSYGFHAGLFPSAFARSGVEIARRVGNILLLLPFSALGGRLPRFLWWVGLSLSASLPSLARGAAASREGVLTALLPRFVPIALVDLAGVAIVGTGSEDLRRVCMLEEARGTVEGAGRGDGRATDGVEAVRGLGTGVAGLPRAGGWMGLLVERR